MRVIAGFVICVFFGTWLPAHAHDHGEDCSSRWHQNYIRGLSSALDLDEWQCFREDLDDLGSGRYAKRTGRNVSGDIIAWYYDAELYGGGYYWKRGVWEPEFNASFLGRVWDINHRDINNDAFLCFEAQSIRRGSHQVLTYCSARTPFGRSGAIKAYDRAIVENIMRNRGVYTPE